MFKRHGGGRKDRWPADVRARAMARAEVAGVEVAAGEAGIPSGTVRSWLRRARLREERDRVDADVLGELLAEGRAIVEAHEGRGLPVRPLARGEYLSPDPLAHLRPPREGPVEELSTTVDTPEPKPKRRRRRGRRGGRKRSAPNDSQASGFAVNAAPEPAEPMRVDFGYGAEPVDSDSIQSKIGGREPRGGSPR